MESRIFTRSLLRLSLLLSRTRARMGLRLSKWPRGWIKVTAVPVILVVAINNLARPISCIAVFHEAHVRLKRIHTLLVLNEGLLHELDLDLQDTKDVREGRQRLLQNKQTV